MESVEKGETGVFQYKVEGYEFFSHYSAVGVKFYDDELASDWRFLIMIPNELAFGNYLKATNDVLNINYALLAIISFIIIGFLIVFNDLFAKNKNLRYTDPVTNGINRERLIIDANKLLKKYRKKGYFIIGWTYKSEDNKLKLKEVYDNMIIEELAIKEF